MQNTVYTGVIAGTLGGAAKLAVNLLFYLAGIAKITTVHSAAAALLPKGTALGTPPSLATGLAVEWLVAVLLGIIAVYLLRLTGRDLLWLKGIVYGGLTWVFGYGYLATLLVPEPLLRPDLATSAAMLAAHLAFGLTALFVAGRYQIEAV